MLGLGAWRAGALRVSSVSSSSQVRSQELLQFLQHSSSSLAVRKPMIVAGERQTMESWPQVTAHFEALALILKVSAVVQGWWVLVSGSQRRTVAESLCGANSNIM